jgi:excisionase family DNA binding protein
MEKVYTIKQVAEHFGVSDRTIYNWVKNHGMGSYCINLGGKMAIMEKDLSRYLEDSRIAN